MFETILTNVLAPVAFIGLFVALPLWWVLRGAARERRLPDSQPAEQAHWISAAAIMSGFGPSWHHPYLRPRVYAAAEALRQREGDPT